MNENPNGPSDESTTWYLWVEHIRPRTLLAVVQEYSAQGQRVMLANVPSPTSIGSAVVISPCSRPGMLALIKRILADRRLTGFGDVWFKSQQTIDREMTAAPCQSGLGRFMPKWLRG